MAATPVPHCWYEQTTLRVRKQSDTVNDRFYDSPSQNKLLVRTWSTLALNSRGNRPYFLSACACPSPLAPPDPAPPDSPAPSDAPPLAPPDPAPLDSPAPSDASPLPLPAPAPFDRRDSGAGFCMSDRSDLWKRWISGRRSSML